MGNILVPKSLSPITLILPINWALIFYLCKKGEIIFEGSNEEFFEQKNLDAVFQNSVKRY